MQENDNVLSVRVANEKLLEADYPQYSIRDINDILKIPLTKWGDFVEDLTTVYLKSRSVVEVLTKTGGLDETEVLKGIQLNEFLWIDDGKHEEMADINIHGATDEMADTLEGIFEGMIKTGLLGENTVDVQKR